MAKRDIKRDFLDPMVLARLRRLPIYARGPVEGSFSGMHRSPHRGSSVEFSQYRKYEPGDDPKHVDWTVFARTDRFYVKEFEADTNLRCYLIIDCSGSMGFRSTGLSKIDYARRLAATLAQLLIQQGDAVGLQCFNDRIVQNVPPRSHAKHLHYIFDVLDGIRPRGETQVVRILHDLAETIRRRALVVVISDLFTEVEPLLDCFHHLRHRKHDLAVFHLLDDAELNFEFGRPIRFVDMETGTSIVTEPGVIRPEYLNVLQSWLGAMLKGCREFHVDYRRVRLSEDYEKVLSRFILDRMK